MIATKALISSTATADSLASGRAINRAVEGHTRYGSQDNISHKQDEELLHHIESKPTIAMKKSWEEEALRYFSPKQSPEPVSCRTMQSHMLSSLATLRWMKVTSIPAQGTVSYDTTAKKRTTQASRRRRRRCVVDVVLLCMRERVEGCACN